MNAVAMNIVATMVSTKFSTATSNESGANQSDFKSFLDTRQAAHTMRPNHAAEVVQNAQSKKSASRNTEAVATRRENNEVKEPYRNSDEVKRKRMALHNDKNHDSAKLYKKVEATEDQIMQEVAGALNITEEELQNIMDSLDMTVVDLLDTSGLQTILVTVRGITDMADLLTNDTFSDLFKEITQTLEETLDANQLTVEDIKHYNQLLDNMKTESVIKETVPELVTNKESGIPVTQAANTDNQNSNLEQAGQSVDGKVVEASTDSQKGSGEQSSEFTNQFNQALTQVVTEKVVQINMAGFEETITTQVSAKNIFDQIVTQMKVISVGDSNTLSFQLQPENLGKIAFSLTNDNGIITGSFMAESTSVKEAIEMNMINLKASLIEQGIKLDEIKIVVGDTKQFFDQQERQHFDQNRQNRKNKRLMRLEEANSTQTPENLEVNDAQTGLSMMEHSVEYSA
ncbi:MAG: flagellar hook-length control protein FliK [Vallitaleaceae bacterium]|jgi:flagellar hook-length control protein FliK|nr:flagellar hook-length control protein FliK [Vallitaleaceae bacterium]